MDKNCEWKHPKAPAARKLWGEGATEAVLELLGDTRVGCWSSAGVAMSPRGAEGEGEVSEGEEGGPGPPRGLLDHGLSLGGGELVVMRYMYGKLYRLFFSPFPFVTLSSFLLFLGSGGVVVRAAEDWGAPL